MTITHLLIIDAARISATVQRRSRVVEKVYARDSFADR